MTAVLLSGGLDSAVLLAEETARSLEVLPLYVSVGLAWESAERAAIGALLTSSPFADTVRPLTTLTIDMSDIYPAEHWAMVGRPPGYHTPDQAVYLPGRNIVLLGKAGVFCAAAGVERIVMATLGENPFPDATPHFRAAMASTLSLGLDHRLRIEAPYAALGKAEVIRRGIGLGVPLELTLSCMSPVATGSTDEFATIARHCGLCSKCRERHQAFVEAAVADPTPYADFTFVATT